MTTGPSRGFTLVEVMVAISVVALIMLTTVAGFRTLGNTASTISLMTDRSNEMRSVSTFLRDAFENSVVGTASGGGDALSFGGSGTGSKPAAYFKVSEDSLEWRSKILFGEAYGGSYFLRLAKRGRNLVLQWQDPRGAVEPGSWDDMPRRKVLEDLEELEVWTRMAVSEEWVREDVVVETLSHVKLVTKASGRYWPELVMAVHR